MIGWLSPGWFRRLRHRLQPLDDYVALSRHERLMLATIAEHHHDFVTIKTLCRAVAAGELTAAHAVISIDAIVR